MDDMESKLGALLNNPEIMQQVMAMAQSLGHAQSPSSSQELPSQKVNQDEKPSIPVSLPFGEPNLAMIQQLSSLASQTNVDQNQKILLKALGPYLSKDRIQKLEKAMRAAKLAQFASAALGQSNFLKNPGR